MIRAALRPLTLEATTKGLDLGWRVAAGVPDRLIGDPGRVRQVLLNLVGNAVKFTSSGHVTVDVTADSRTGMETTLRCSIADTGIGIPAHKQERIFETFTQADGSTTREYGGTGLGLAICRQLVQRMGGLIWVESRIGSGSTFHFTIQALVVAAREAGEVTLVQAPDATSEARGKRVLLAGGDPLSRRVVTRGLEKEGYDVVEVESGREVMAALAREAFDVLLIDLDMPQREGLETITAIRVAESTRAVPIVGVSEATDDLGPDIEQALDGHVTRPIDTASLLASVGAAVQAAARQLEKAGGRAETRCDEAPGGSTDAASVRPRPKAS
jgi:CheY-like chemotaxis protein